MENKTSCLIGPSWGWNDGEKLVDNIEGRCTVTHNGFLLWHLSDAFSGWGAGVILEMDASWFAELSPPTGWSCLTLTSLSLTLARVLSSRGFSWLLSRLLNIKYVPYFFFVKKHFGGMQKPMRILVWYFPKRVSVWHVYSSIFVASLLRVWSSSSSGPGRAGKITFMSSCGWLWFGVICQP